MTYFKAVRSLSPNRVRAFSWSYINGKFLPKCSAVLGLPVQPVPVQVRSFYRSSINPGAFINQGSLSTDATETTSTGKGRRHNNCMERNLASIRYNSSSKPPHPSTEEILAKALQKPAGPLYGKNSDGTCATVIKPDSNDFFIPQVALYENDGRRRKRVLVLCTGGTLTMAPDPEKGGALAPVEGAVTAYMKNMNELCNESMPEVVCHEYKPFFDSSDLGPNDWAVLASDIKANYWHFDGFVVLMGTDTMAYAATALSFMLEVSILFYFKLHSKLFAHF